MSKGTSIPSVIQLVHLVIIRISPGSPFAVPNLPAIAAGFVPEIRIVDIILLTMFNHSPGMRCPVCHLAPYLMHVVSQKFCLDVESGRHYVAIAFSFLESAKCILL